MSGMLDHGDSWVHQGAPLVDVLLATYNGARFVEAQLESLANQTFTNIRVLVSDDGSDDATVSIVHGFAQRMGDGFIKWIRSPSRGRGPTQNFEALMAASLADGSARWLLFCDQDDVWLPHKVECFARAMAMLEGDDEKQPCLVHSDLRVVDAQLRTIVPSFVSQQHIDPAATSLSVQLSVNHVTGCAMMINRALLAMALPLPKQVVMHDWWCALISCVGRRYFIADQLVLYRQHGANQVGARSRKLKDRLLRLSRDGKATWQRVRWLGRGTLAQAQALQERFRLLGVDDAPVAEYLRWRGLRIWQRMTSYRRYYKGPALDNLCRLLLW